MCVLSRTYTPEGQREAGMEVRFIPVFPELSLLGPQNNGREVFAIM